MPHPPCKSRPVKQYIVLALLLAISLSYQVRRVAVVYPEWFGMEPVAPPFSFLATQTLDGAKFPAVIAPSTPDARAAGLKTDDVLLSVNGRDLRGTGVFGEEIAKAHVGDVMAIRVLRRDAKGSSSEVALRIPITAQPKLPLKSRLLFIFLIVAMPAFASLLGFWVAAVRPRDPLSWLVLALMLSYLGFNQPFIESWGPEVRDFAEVFRSAATSAFAISFLLFGIYFPERFPASSRWARLDRLKWLVIAPLVALDLVETIVSVGNIENFAAVQPLNRRIITLLPVDLSCTFLALSLGVACLIAKNLTPLSCDAKRRLRLLMVGSLVTLCPLIALQAIAYVRHEQPQTTFPAWVTAVSFILFLLFPILLAYVIAVQRAMDARLVLRQGLQYALARNGIRAIQVIVIMLVSFVAASLLGDSARGRGEKVLTLLVLVAAVFSAGRIAKSLLRWTDRRFFREAYDAEQVLSDLGDKVRTIVEPRSLLEMVTERISATLHVPQIAVLLDAGSPYQPAYALGYEGLPKLSFSSQSATVRLLQTRQEPLRVYFDDDSSWLYRDAQSTEEDREKLAHLKSELLLPLTAREKLLGFISLGRKRSEEPFTGSDLRLLKSVASQTGLALENAQLLAAITEEVAQRERLNREVEIAREVQERLFPQELPAILGLDYSGACRPALGVGGDYYDFLALADGRLGIAIGDVSGKGIGAALMMASLQASLRAEATRTPEDLARVVGKVNRLVYQASTSNRYATFFYAQYEADTCRLTYVNAGHNPPMLLRKERDEWQVIRLTDGGTVIGLLPNSTYQQESIVL